MNRLSSTASVVAVLAASVVFPAVAHAAHPVASLETELEQAVACKRPIGDSARGILRGLRRAGIATQDFDDGAALILRYPLPAGTTLFGEPARYVVIDTDHGYSGALVSTLYVELADGHGDAVRRLKHALRLDGATPDGYREFDFTASRMTRYFKTRAVRDGTYVVAVGTSPDDMRGDVVAGCQYYLSN
ncbi:hypothetical protein ACVBGC_04010 [Burkholderia stagnalis]